MVIRETLPRNAKPRLEVKARRVGGATYQVPLEVPPDRQFALALRWLVDFADARKGIPMREALAASDALVSLATVLPRNTNRLTDSGLVRQQALFHRLHR